jgi:primosomal replication protein N
VNCNRLELCGDVTEVAELRYTPAGIPILGFTLRHSSQQNEAGMTRKVECEIPAVVIGALAEASKGLLAGGAVRVAGFLARRSLNSRQLILHINELEII